MRLGVHGVANASNKQIEIHLNEVCHFVLISKAQISYLIGLDSSCCLENQRRRQLSLGMQLCSVLFNTNSITISPLAPLRL